jgi:predicted membrane chloride channel (bestrophin family)
LLVFYLFFLPLALRGGNMLNGLGTVLTTSAVAYTMLGLDEISHLLEQPFKLMPLYHLSKNSMRDVGDAIVCQPPPLDNGEQKASAPYQTPPYWQV